MSKLEGRICSLAKKEDFWYMKKKTKGTGTKKDWTRNWWYIRNMEKTGSFIKWGSPGIVQLKSTNYDIWHHKHLQACQGDI